jgi:hypothetical protein
MSACVDQASCTFSLHDGGARRPSSETSATKDEKMSRRIICFGFALIVASASQGLGVSAYAQSSVAPAVLPEQIAGCDAGVKIDGTTAEQTKKKIEAAGYTQVRDLAKACDNVWHGTAVNKDGVSGNVMVTPQGEVMPEGN